MQPQERLATEMRARRRELRLSAREAARRAGIARNTWAAAEDGTRTIQDNAYKGIEQALQWDPGSITTILTGGHPTLAAATDTPDNAQPQPVIDLEEELDRVKQLNVSATVKLKLVQALVELHAQASTEASAEVRR